MNKKILIILILVVALMAGLAYWHLHRQTATKNLEDPLISQIADKHLVEIFYLPHAPAKAIVQKVEPIIAKFPNYTVKEYNFEDPANKQKIADYNLVNHTPITIFIGGKNSFTVDGKTVTLINFPKGDAFIPSLEGQWSYEDLEKILANQK
jgi:hypothetical protein